MSAPGRRPPYRLIRRSTSTEAQRDTQPPDPALSEQPRLVGFRQHSSSSSRSSSRRLRSVASRRAERIINLQSRISSSADDARSRFLRAERSLSGEDRPADFEDLDRSLDEANSHLRALLDMTSNVPDLLAVPDTEGYGPLDEAVAMSEDSRRHKRRKLSADRFLSPTKRHRYGKYGQVEPGQLRMQIMSCDGGMFSNELSYAAENILKDDASVYCTKGSRCNIVLRHQDMSTFTLQELVIKAPAGKDYSYPVREGMVFVSMDDHEHFQRTAQYLIQYHSRNEDPSSNGPISGYATERLPEPSEVISIQHHDDGTTSTRLRRTHIYRTADDDNDDDSRIARMPPEFAENLPDSHVTTHCSDDEDDLNDGYENIGSVRFRRRPPNRIGFLPFEDMDHDFDSDDVPVIPLNLQANDSIDQYTVYGATNPRNFYHLEDLGNMSRSRRIMNAIESSHDPESPWQNPPSSRPRSLGRHTEDPNTGSISNRALADAWEAHVSATQDAVRAINNGYPLLAPHARFFIEKNKSKCTIRFDPPVSGRFILLKMWSSYQDPSSNIDIQSVIAHGFAGPRYFPSVELR